MGDAAGAAALEEVRRRVSGADGPAPGSAEAAVGYLRSEHMLVRFLVARQWDTEKACQMLREHYRWLAETRMSALLEDPWPEEAQIKRYYPQAYHGTDKLGRPIYIERPGLIDMPRLMQCLSPERLVQYMAMGSELQIRRRLPACSVVRGEVVDKSLTIMDLEGLGFRVVTHATARKVLKEVVAVLQDHYPEVAGRTIIINAPRVFSIAWSFVMPMLDAKTVAKISIFGTDRSVWTAALLELVDADQLPALFGGRCRCDGKDDLSCIGAAKGPWADPTVLAVLSASSIERAMTPEGAASLHEQWREGLGVAAGELSSEERPRAASAEPEAEPVGQAVAEQAAGEEEEEEDRPEIRRLASDLAALQREHQQREEAHVATITAWIGEYNRLTGEIGRHVVERSQGYYDALALWQQAVQDYARQRAEVVDVGARLGLAKRTLSSVEAALRGDDRLPEEEWVRIAPLPDEEGGEPAPEAALLVEEGGADGRLVHALRMSVLADRVASLQRRRDATDAELAARIRDVDECRARFEREEQLHGGCTWNCSVRRAAPFQEARRLHEVRVETQRAELGVLEARLQEARRALAELQGAQLPWQDLDDASPQHFEIPAGAPAEDEWGSCFSSDIPSDDEGNI